MSEFQRSSTTSTYGAPRRHLQVVPTARPFRTAATSAAAATPAVSAPPVATPVWAHRLSDREVEVLHCIAAGLSTNEIAQTLFISTATVKSHVARLIAKVEVRDRLQLVIAAYRTGFVRVG